MIVVPNSVSASILAALTGVGGTLNGAKCHLFQNNVVPSIGFALADLVEADFDGYAASAAVTWSVPIDNQDGNGPVVVGDNKLFIATAPFVVPNTIYGWYLTNGAGTVLLAAERYATAKQISEAGNAIGVVPQWGAVSQSGS